MSKLLYTVRAICRDVPQRGRFLSWLVPNHVLQVMAGGAESVRVVLHLPDDLSRDAGRATDPGLAAASNRVSGQTPAGQQAGTARPPHNDTAPARPELAERAVVETQYVFPSRKAFDTYVRDHAPALRADGLKHFPPESGVTYERQVAEVAFES